MTHQDETTRAHYLNGLIAGKYADVFDGQAGDLFAQHNPTDESACTGCCQPKPKPRPKPKPKAWCLPPA